MAELYGVLLLLLIFPSPLNLRQDSGSRESTQVRKIPLTRTIRIPLIEMPEGGEAGSRKTPSAMAVSPGATDELPLGPNAFDVLEDGSVVITDPLLRRLVVYNAAGAFRRSYDVGFSPDSVTVMTDGLMLVREANTGQMHAFDREGNVYSGKMPKPASLPPALRLSAKEGTIASVLAGSAGRTISVRLDEPDTALLSLEGLATDPDRGTFVALETTVPKSGADAIDVRKIVRRYSPRGVLVAESSPIPLDYYVQPVDELRVRKGVVYQLMTTRTEVRINEWDTN